MEAAGIDLSASFRDHIVRALAVGSPYDIVSAAAEAGPVGSRHIAAGEEHSRRIVAVEV